MSSESVGIGEPSPGISSKDRRWAILQWLSVKMPEATPNFILEAARDFEVYIVGNIVGRDISEAAVASIRKLDPAAGKIVAAAAEESSSETLARAPWADQG